MTDDAEDIAARVALLQNEANELEKEIVGTGRVYEEELHTLWGLEKRLKEVRRELARLQGTEYVSPLDLLPRFDGRYGHWNGWRVETVPYERVFLYIRVLLSERRRETLVVSFEKTKVFTFGWPNVEVFDAHPLRDKGIDLFGLFEVKNSAKIRQMRAAMERHSSYGSTELDGSRHFILKDEPGEFSCVAQGVDAWVSAHGYEEINASLANVEWATACAASERSE